MSSLAGRRILLTRTADGCAAWAREIERAGGRPLSVPCIRVEVDRSPALADRTRAAVEAADWVVFASRRGVDACRDIVGAIAAGMCIAAVGPATARAAESAWGRVDLVAPEGTAASLGSALVERLAGEPGVAAATVASVAAAGGRRELDEALERAGAKIVRLELYRSVWEPAEGEPRTDLKGRVDVVLLASPSAARGLVARAELDPRVDVVTIGPSTSEAARELGLKVTAQARERSLQGMLEVLP